MTRDTSPAVTTQQHTVVWKKPRAPRPLQLSVKKVRGRSEALHCPNHKHYFPAAVLVCCCLRQCFWLTRYSLSSDVWFGSDRYMMPGSCADGQTTAVDGWCVAVVPAGLDRPNHGVLTPPPPPPFIIPPFSPQQLNDAAAVALERVRQRLQFVASLFANNVIVQVGALMGWRISMQEYPEL